MLKAFIQGVWFGLGIVSLGFTAVILCSAAHADVLKMTCYPAHYPYDVSFDTETRIGTVTGSKSGVARTYTAHDVKNNDFSKIFYAALTAPGQTRTLYLAYDYSGLHDVSAIKTTDNGHEATDKCTFRRTIAASPAPPPVPAPQQQPAPPPDLPTTMQPRTQRIRIEPCDTRDFHQCAIITLTGEILNGDGAEFINRTKDISSARVDLSSPGGAVEDGLLIGLQVYDKGFSTAVLGGAFCHSACANIWVAGKRREMGPNSELAWHVAFNGDDPGNADGMGNMLVGMYFQRLHFSANDVERMFGHDPNDFHVTVSDSNGVQTRASCRMTSGKCIRKVAE